MKRQSRNGVFNGYAGSCVHCIVCEHMKVTLLPVCVNNLQKNNLEVTPCFEDNDIILKAGCDFQIMVDAILKCASHLHVTLYQE